MDASKRLMRGGVAAERQDSSRGLLAYEESRLISVYIGVQYATPEDGTRSVRAFPRASAPRSARISSHPRPIGTGARRRSALQAVGIQEV